MLAYLLLGASLGLANGLAPGPLQTLVISESVRGGWRSGLMVAVSPLITDLLIVPVTLLAVGSGLSTRWEAGLFLVGGLFILFLAWQNITFRPGEMEATTKTGSPLVRGILTNFLSPYPYLFWFTIGASTVSRAGGMNSAGAWIFIGGMYATLLAAFGAVSVAVSAGRSLLNTTGYLWTMRGLGLLLAGFGLAFLYQAAIRLT